MDHSYSFNKFTLQLNGVCYIHGDSIDFLLSIHHHGSLLQVLTHCQLHIQDMKYDFVSNFSLTYWQYICLYL